MGNHSLTVVVRWAGLRYCAWSLKYPLSPADLCVKGRQRMTIGKKISWSCAGLVALSLILGIFSLWSVARIEGRLDSIVNDSLPGVYQIGKVESLAQDFR